MEIELKKKETVSSNTLAGKPISITKFKNGEVLAYNSSARQWEAKAPSGTVDLSGYYTKSQVDALIPEIPTIPSQLSDLIDDTTHRLITDLEKVKMQQSIIFTYTL